MSTDSTSSGGLATGRQSQKRGWSYAVIGLAATAVLFTASQVFGGLVVSFYPVILHWSRAQTNAWFANLPVGAQFAFVAASYGLLLAGIALVLHYFGWTWAKIGLRRPKPVHLLAGLLTTVPYFLLYIFIVAILTAVVPGFNARQAQDIGFNSVHGLLPLAITFVSLVVLPPLVEEITMRGFLYTSLRQWLPRLLAAFVVSLLFAMAHLPEGGNTGPLWVAALDTYILSLFLIVLREMTGNLWAGIILHAAKNFVAFAVLFIIGGR